MKSIYLLLAFLTSTVLSAQDYYWVGNSGNWSDLSHWATTSGGSNFHTELPGSENNVYFDENSFSEINQIVTIDITPVYCHDLDATGAAFNPQLKGLVYTDQMHIYGDLILPAEFGRNLKAVYMMSEETAEIYTGGINLGSTTFFNTAGEGGTFYLMDSMAVANLYLGTGTFISNNNPVNVFSRVYGHVGMDQAADFGTSNVYANLWNMNDDIDLNMESATLYYGSPGNIFNEFHGGAFHYHRVVFDGVVDLEGDNSYDVFEVLPGSEIHLDAGSVQTAGQFILDGTSASAITINSNENGEQATFHQSSGTVDADYLILTDNNATGGAVFNANESIDQGNNTGWNITITIPQDYFWIGGSGSWDDLSHWATTSGGAVLHENLPSAVDNVIFDENSFSSDAAIVDLADLVLNCHHLSLDAPSNATFIQGGNGILNVYGDVTMSGEPTLEFMQITMQSNTTATVNANDIPLGPQAELLFSGGGSYELLSSLELRALKMEPCDFNSGGNTIHTNFEVLVLPGFDGLLDFSGSSVYTRAFNHSLTPDEIVSDETEFFITGSFSADNLEIYRLILGGAEEVVEVYGNFSVEELIIIPGSEVELRSGFTIAVEEIYLDGTSDEPITVFSSTPGEEAFISKEEGVVNGYHLNLTDNHATGGAIFTAYDSNMGSNVVGWNGVTGVNEISLADRTIVYPNPAVDFVKVETISGSEINIFDNLGRLVKTIKNLQPHQITSLAGFETGIYLMEISAPDNAQTTKKLVVR